METIAISQFGFFQLGTVEREKAELGVLITLDEPTGPMRKEAAEAGF